MAKQQQLSALCLVVALLACSSGSVLAQRRRQEPAQPVPDLLETSSLPTAVKSNWRQVARFMWNWLLTHDHDYYDAAGNVVSSMSATVASAKSGPTVKCGRFARNWIRLAFHDCGTYSVFLRRFGCNGSIRKELPMTEPWLDYTKLNPDGKSFAVLGPDVFDKFKVNGVLNPLVDVELSPEHKENAGSAASVSAFYEALLFAKSLNVGLWEASFSDILILGSLLGMARCDGPHIKFMPGRVDSPVADTAELLPAFEDDFMHTLHYFYQSGLSELDAVTLIGGAHSTACFHAGCLDATPSKTDKDWASQVLNWNGVSPPICDVNVAPTATNLCMAPSDTIWLKYQQSKDYLALLLSTSTNVINLQREIQLLLDKQQVTSYQGLVPTANLCLSTTRTCPGFAENWAFHTMLASSMWRLINMRPINF